MGTLNLLDSVVTFLAIHTGCVMFKDFKKLLSSCFSTGLEALAKAPERWVHSSPALVHGRPSGTYS